MSTDEVAERSESERLKRIHKVVKRVKLSEKTGVKLMQRWEEDAMIREEGFEEGHSLGMSTGLSQGLSQGEQRLAALIQKLIATGKNELIEKVVVDAEIRRQMFKEYGIV